MNLYIIIHVIYVKRDLKQTMHCMNMCCVCMILVDLYFIHQQENFFITFSVFWHHSSWISIYYECSINVFALLNFSKILVHKQGSSKLLTEFRNNLVAHVTLNVHDMLFMMCRVHKVCSSKTLVWWRFHIRFWIRLNLDNRYFVSSWLLFLFEMFIYFSSLKYLPGWKYSLILMHPL